MLEYQIVISFIKPYETDGHTPYLVLADDYCNYVLKAPNNINDKDSLVKEFVCSYLLKYLGIPTPEIKALKIHEVAKNSSYYKEDKRFSYSNVFFGSKHIKDAVDSTNLNTPPINQIVNIDHILLIALFDILVENDDRKPTNHNLLYSPTIDRKLQIFPIDHSFTFSSLNFNQLDYNFVSFSDNDSILYQTKLGLIAYNSIGEDKEQYLSLMKTNFLVYLDKCREVYPHICKNIPSELDFTKEKQDKLYSFLFSETRINKVFENFYYILNNIK